MKKYILLLKKFTKRNWPILLILILGFFLRSYKNDQLFMYSHDNDLAGWVIKDIVVDGHPRLIGQETSTSGIFIGGLFYYLQIPFYLLSGMDPIGGTYLVALLGVIYILGVYLIFKRVFSKRVALIGVFLYAFSFYFIFNDREVVPTQPVVFWSIALFFGFTEIIKGNVRKGMIICAVLFSMVWHLNFALILPAPLLLFCLYHVRKKIKITDLLIAASIFIILSLPLLYFEVKHDFIQSRALISSLNSNQNDIVSGWEKVVRTYHLISKNLFSIFLPSLSILRYEHVMLIFIGIYLYLLKKVKEYRSILLFLAVWFAIYFLFFSLYSKRVSEYYLNGIQFIPVVVFSLFIDRLLDLKAKKVAISILIIFLIINIFRFFKIPINKSGYIERKAVVSEINEDAIKHGYPCISISYITNPGYNLGYRYFFWMMDMHVNNPSSGSPVYTIVFPLNERLFPVGKTFGAIGLIYPDYSRYTKEVVESSCLGANSNLTDPMFGFTK